MGASNLQESLMNNIGNENNPSDDVFTLEMYACGGSVFLWAGSILVIYSYHQLRIWVVFTALVVKGLTNIA